MKGLRMPPRRVSSGATRRGCHPRAPLVRLAPGLSLFYGGMVRKKNVLATMMQSYAAMAVVGLYWIAVGYGLAFGPSQLSITLFEVRGGIVGWSPDLFFLRGVNPDAWLAGNNITVYTHVMFQGMFAIVTPALISGAWPSAFASGRSACT